MNMTTEIVIVLDRSGSMKSIKEETISGYNKFLRNQKELEGKAYLTLVQFDDLYQIDYNGIDIQKVPLLDCETYKPRGLTALLDAIGKTIKEVNKRHKTLLDDTPSKTIFAIITDGHENHSRKYTPNDIAKKIRKMERRRKWEFVFLGANQDAFTEAGRIGINRKRAITFSSDNDGIKDVFNSFSSIAGCIRSEKDKEFEFTDEDREKQKRARRS